MERGSSAPKYMSILIILFWMCNLAQVPELREDYPFSYFGMYKRSILDTAYTKFTIRIREQGEESFKTYPVGTFAFLNTLNAIVLREKKLKNREYIVPPQALSEQESGDLPVVPSEALKRVVSDLVKKKPGTYETQIIYEEWEKLNARSMLKPDYRQQVSEQVVQINGQ